MFTQRSIIPCWHCTMRASCPNCDTSAQPSLRAVPWIPIPFNRLKGQDDVHQGISTPMSTQPVEPKPALSPNLVQIGSPIEDVIKQRLLEERARLESEAGVAKREVHH